MNPRLLAKISTDLPTAPRKGPWPTEALLFTQIPCADFFDARDDALRAHATQIDPNGPFFAVPSDVQRRVWPTEEFELARTRVRTSLPEDDLFAGIEPDEGPSDGAPRDDAPKNGSAAADVAEH